MESNSDIWCTVLAMEDEVLESRHRPLAFNFWRRVLSNSVSRSVLHPIQNSDPKQLSELYFLAYLYVESDGVQFQNPPRNRSHNYLTLTNSYVLYSINGKDWIFLGHLWSNTIFMIWITKPLLPYPHFSNRLTATSKAVPLENFENKTKLKAHESF